MRALVLAILSFCTLSGVWLCWTGPWGPAEEQLHLAHGALGALAALPACWFLAGHMEDAAGRRLIAPVLGALIVLQAVYLLYFDFHPSLVAAKFLIAGAVLFWGAGVRRALAVFAATLGVPVVLDPLSALWPDLRFQWETIQLVAPIWLSVGLALRWLARPAKGTDRLAQHLGPPLRAAAWASGGAFLFLLGTGLILLAGGGLYREGRLALVAHRAVGLAVVPLVLYHVARAWMAGRGLPGLGKRASPPVALAGLAVAAVLVGGPKAVEPAVEARRILAPSVVATPTGHPYAAWTAADGRAGCGGAACHEAVTLQWEQSAHRFAASSPVFRATVEVARTERGAEAVRFCAGCHAPAVALSALEPASRPIDDPLWAAGVSCSGCHLARDADERSLTLELDTELPRELDQRARQPFVLGPVEHTRRYMDPVVRTPELCASCHRQVLPPAFGVEAAGRVLHDQYSSWRDGPFGPASDDPRSCADCHMARSVANPFEFAVRDHRMPGMNHWLAGRFAGDGARKDVQDVLLGASRVAVPEYDAFWRRDRHPSWPFAGIRELRSRLGEAWEHREEGLAAIQDRLAAEDAVAAQGGREDPAPGYGLARYGGGTGRMAFGVSGAASRPSGPAFELTLDAAPEAAGWSGTATARAPGVGHRFPNGPQDLVETAWLVEAIATDGTVVAVASRELGETHLDGAGLPIARHRIWTVRADRDGGHIPAGGELRWAFHLRIPEGVRVDALRSRLLHRPLRPAMLAWAERRPASATEAEIPLLALAETTLKLSSP